MHRKPDYLVAALVILGLTLSIRHDNLARPTYADTSVTWTLLSTQTGDLPVPSRSTRQAAARVFDVDLDGDNDFVIGSQREPGAAVVWYRRESAGWSKYLIDDTPLDIEAGGAEFDIDGDGDLDLVLGGDLRSNQVWWWENPHPNHDPNVGWTRRLVKNSGSSKHHDMIFGDFDGDGQAEFVFWNQRGRALFLAEIPADAKTTQPWSFTPIYTWTGETEHEGLTQADVDGDGKVDIIGGGRWFKHTGGLTYRPFVIDDQQRFTRAAVGQLKAGGYPEVVFGAGDVGGPLKWYEWNGNGWIGRDLLGFNIRRGHSLEIADINQDGQLDIFAAEMRLGGESPDAKMWIFFGDGAGNFQKSEVASGFDNHESRVADLDNDGDLDILGKPWNWETPQLNIWLNNSEPVCTPGQPQWRRHLIDADKPARSIFITAADLNGDNRPDIVTGGWWYQNPGTADGVWTRRPIGAPLNNMALAEDLDGDGDVDILGTEGVGSAANASFVWARNDGAGNFTIGGNLAPAAGNFLQGAATGRFQPGGPLTVVLSWHDRNQGLQSFTVPADPVNNLWPWGQLSAVSQNEDLSAGDIDGDGDLDLLLGTQWLRNEGGSPLTWQPFTLHQTAESPDRNRLVDLNGDGRLDAVVTYEARNATARVAWYEQPADPTASWLEHEIALLFNPLSLDVGDIDGDGDPDVVVGEHNLHNPASARLFVFTNLAGNGSSWAQQVVYTGDEHHDGTQLVDVDTDGDLDIISIGWGHNRVTLYEQIAAGCGGEPTPTPLPTPAPTVCGEQRGLQALYTFEEGGGNTIQDVSGVGEPLPLTIRDAGHIAWLPEGGVRVYTPTLIVSTAPATKLIGASQQSAAFTLEAWIRPALLNQPGPARIVTLSQDPLARNFTLGQGVVPQQEVPLLEARVRTTATDPNGRPPLTTPGDTVDTSLMHVVYAHTADGQRTVYVDGVVVAVDELAGDFANWDQSHHLALANEVTGDRPWLGEYHRVAIYQCAFAAEDVARHFAAGPRGPTNQNPTASFMADPITGAAPLTVRFDAAASSDPDGTIIGYAWDFGNGSTATGLTSEQVYPAAGVYTASLTVTDNSGATATTTATITVTAAPASEPPSIQQQPADVTAAPGQSATFVLVAAGTPPLAYQWRRNGVDLPGATGSSLTVPAVHPEDHGALFTCIVTNAGGSATSAAARLTVSETPGSPIARFTANPLGGKAPLTVAFDATPATAEGPIAAYGWNFGDGSAATGLQVTHEYVTPGLYPVTLTITDTTGATNQTTVEIGVNPPNVAPTASFTTTITAGGAPLLVQLDATSASDSDGRIVDYRWVLGDGTTALGARVTHTYTTPGAYTVQLTVTDDNGASASTQSIIQVTTQATAPQIASQPQDRTVREGESATFAVAAAGTAPLIYQWQHNGAIIPGATAPVYITPAATSADHNTQYACVVTNAAGSVTTRSAWLTVRSPGGGAGQLLYLPLVAR
jgi:PKD repeat protein